MSRATIFLEPTTRRLSREALRALEAEGIDVTVTSTKRSHGEQIALWQRWLSGKQKFPVAPPGTSKHEAGIAIDLVVHPAALSRTVAIFQSKGFRWAGPADPVHFELDLRNPAAQAALRKFGFPRSAILSAVPPAPESVRRPVRRPSAGRLLPDQPTVKQKIALEQIICLC